MSEMAYLQINLIPIVVLVILRINTRRTLSYTWRSRDLRFIMVVVACIMVVDAAAWYLDGRQSSGAAVGIWILDTIYFALMEFVAFLWYLYVKDVVEDGLGQRGRDVWISGLPLVLFNIFLITNPWHHLLFYVNAENYYARGKLFWVHTALADGYLVLASARALLGCRKESTREKRVQYYLLAAFVLLPIFAGIIQVFFYGTSLVWSCTAASLVMVYINLQWKQVTRDGLTGLNNRRRMDQYLDSLEPWQDEQESWYLMLLDVDRFKKINDTYGHVVGDVVLRGVADQLKKLFGDAHAFLARYGGDEFVIIIRSRQEQEILKLLDAIPDAMERIVWGDEKAWKVKVSVGYVKYDKNAMHGTREWFKLADEKMYQQKSLKKH